MNPDERTVHTQAELEATWRDLVKPLGWSRPRFWIMLIEPAGRPLPQLIQIDELEGAPQDQDVERGAQFLQMLVDELDVGELRVGVPLRAPRPREHPAARPEVGDVVDRHGAARGPGLRAGAPGERRTHRADPA